ncbi:MAG: hypothetical protein O2779_05165 [Nanoarchaeota archaeon]|nr:hypothetical protein [Nanoarchaeota archaeon]
MKDPSQPDLEEITTMVTRRGRRHQVFLERWNDVIVQGSNDERTHEHPFDLLRVKVIDKNGKPVYRRPLWLMITGLKRKKVSSKDSYLSYGRRYDIEHFFRFGKQKLGLVNSQTCETRHEKNWHWIGLLSYTMLYHARQLTRPVAYPWEKRKVDVIASTERPSQVQRDYGRIIRQIGTPAPSPKPRGKSFGREAGCDCKKRPDRPPIRKGKKQASSEFQNCPSGSGKKSQNRTRYKRMKHVWGKNRPAPMRC